MVFVLHNGSFWLAARRFIPGIVRRVFFALLVPPAAMTAGLDAAVAKISYQYVSPILQATEADVLLTVGIVAVPLLIVTVTSSSLLVTGRLITPSEIS